jgi:hypothetical protein
MKRELNPQATFRKRLAQYLDYMGSPASGSDVLKFSFLSKGEDNELEEVIGLVQNRIESSPHKSEQPITGQPPVV